MQSYSRTLVVWMNEKRMLIINNQSPQVLMWISWRQNLPLWFQVTTQYIELHIFIITFYNLKMPGVQRKWKNLVIGIFDFTLIVKGPCEANTFVIYNQFQLKLINETIWNMNKMLKDSIIPNVLLSRVNFGGLFSGIFHSCVPKTIRSSRRAGVIGDMAHY